MELPFSLALALRYLIPHRIFLSVITILSILGIVVAVMCLVVVIPVMSGFEASVKERLLGSQPHALLKQVVYGQPSVPGGPLTEQSGLPITDWQTRVAQARELPGVELAFPVVEGFVMLEHAHRRSPQPMFAVDPEDETLIREFAGGLDQERWPGSSADLSQFPQDSAADGVCLLNSVTAESLQIQPGALVTLYSPSTLEKILESLNDLERPALANRAGERLLGLRERLLAALQPAAATPDQPAPAAGTPLSEAAALSIPLGLADEIYQTLGELQDPENRQSDNLQLIELGNLFENSLRVDESTNQIIFPANRNASPLADLRDGLEDLGTPPTQQEEDDSLRQLKRVVLPKTLQVIGVFRGYGNSSSVIVPLHIGQELYSLENQVHAIGVRTTDPYQVDTDEKLWAPIFANSWGDEAGISWSADTWLERWGSLFGQIRNERKIMYIILFFIVIVACFSICNTLVTTTVLKRREVGLLKAFGATGGQINLIFLLQGAIVGLIGTLSGLGVGLLLLQLRNPLRDRIYQFTGYDLFPPDVYQLDGGIPAIIRPEDMLTICLGAFILACLAALPPAMIISRLQPAPALRAQGA